EYCYNMMTTFNKNDYFDHLVKTKDKEFIKSFVVNFNNKGYSKIDTSENNAGKFNNIKSLEPLIRENDCELLEYMIEFSNQEALNEALFITNEDQIEIIK